MSVIAWDGKRLAADKRACLGTTIRTTTKIFTVYDCLVGYCGEASFGEELLAWFRAGANPAEFPASLRGKDDWAELLVIVPGKIITKYERTPYPLTFHDEYFAIGSGRDFALAAMYCGKTAIEAVKVACLFDSACGNGIDVLPYTEKGDRHNE